MLMGHNKNPREFPDIKENELFSLALMQTLERKTCSYIL
jgi:hypothetical protein